MVRGDRVDPPRSVFRPTALRYVGCRSDPLQPDLPPVLLDAAGAALVVVGEADEPVQDDAVALDVDHLPGLLVDQPVDPPLHPGPLAAVAQHLDVEAQAPVVAGLVQGGEDLLLGLDPDRLTRLEVERPRGGAALDPALYVGVRAATAEQQEPGQEPAVGPLELVEQVNGQPADDLADGG